MTRIFPYSLLLFLFAWLTIIPVWGQDEGTRITRLDIPLDTLDNSSIADTLQTYPEAILVIDKQIVVSYKVFNNHYYQALQYEKEDRQNGWLYLNQISRLNFVAPPLSMAKYGLKAREGALEVTSNNYQQADRSTTFSVEIGQGVLSPANQGDYQIAEQFAPLLFGTGYLADYQLSGQLARPNQRLVGMASYQQANGPVRDYRFSNSDLRLKYRGTFINRLTIELSVNRNLQNREALLGELMLPGAPNGLVNAVIHADSAWPVESDILFPSTEATPHPQALLGMRSFQQKTDIQRYRGSLHFNFRHWLWYQGKVNYQRNASSFSHTLPIDSSGSLVSGLIGSYGRDWSQSQWNTEHKLHATRGSANLEAGYRRQDFGWDWQENSMHDWTTQQFFLTAEYNPGSEFKNSASLAWQTSSHLEGGYLNWQIESKWKNSIDQFGYFHIYPRISLQQHGNDPLNSLPSIAALGQWVQPTWGMPVLGTAREIGISDELDWEKVRQANVGGYAGLSGGFSARLNLYQKNIRDFSAVVLDAQSQAELANVGKVRMRGADASVTWDNYYLVGVTLGASWLGSRTLELVDGQEEVLLYPGTELFAGSVAMRVGDPILSIYGYQQSGTYQEGDDFSLEPDKAVGDLRLVDLNGDGQLDADDRTLMGSSLPEWDFILRIFKSHSRYRFSLSLQAQTGFEVVNYNQAMSLQPGESRVTDLLVEKGNHLRLREVSFSYQVLDYQHYHYRNNRPRHSLHLYVTGSNLLLLTNYSGFDPGLNSLAEGLGQLPSIDYGAYPATRQVSVGVRYQFD